MYFQVRSAINYRCKINKISAFIQTIALKKKKSYAITNFQMHDAVRFDKLRMEFFFFFSFSTLLQDFITICIV